jgi:hypothetical protein
MMILGTMDVRGMRSPEHRSSLCSSLEIRGTHTHTHTHTHIAGELLAGIISHALVEVFDEELARLAQVCP